jgi:hypothetical protein
MATGLAERAALSREARSTCSLADRAGTWAAALTTVLAAVAMAVGVTTPPRTGPFAAPGTALAYPFTAAVQYVPRDFLWMYPATALMLAFVVLAACVHARSTGGRRLPGLIGLCLATAAFTVLAVDYFIQLQVVQPGLVAGEGADLVALSQYNPRGVFIALENLGYLIAGSAFFCLALALGATRLEHLTRWVFVTAAVLVTVAFVVLWGTYGLGLDYRFEVAALSVDWITLMVSGALLIPVFRGAHRDRRT